MLNVLLWLPLAFALICLVAPRRVAPWSAALGSVVALGLAVGLVADFDTGLAGLQHTVDSSWIPDLGVRYQLGIDGISLFLVALTALLWAAATVFSVLRGYPGSREAPADAGRTRLYYFLLGLGETATLGAFLAQDLLLFVLFFDLMLVPFFFLIGTFGGRNRVAATTKMIVYTLVGSLLMLVGAIATAILASQETGELSFAIADLRANLLSEGSQEWIFCFFAAAFLVKMPAIPIHGWLPDAYRAAPLPVLALLSGVLSKVGAYGFLRVVFPLYPDATATFQELVLVIGVASILYGSVLAFTQTNVRLIAGYSSIAQLGFITIGVFSLRADGADGAVLQMVNHGLVVAAIFLIIAVLYERSGTEDLREMGGLALRAPVLAALFLVVTMATLAIPGSANFIGEFYILNGVFQAKIVYAIVASAGVALAAFYALRLYQRTMHNRLPEGIESREISVRDGAVLVPLVGVIVALAFYPGLILERGETSVDGEVGAVALADCGFETAYSKSAVGEPAVAGVAAGAPCADDYGLAEEEVLAAGLPPCNSTVQTERGGYFIRTCFADGSSNFVGNPPRLGEGWTGFAPFDPPDGSELPVEGE
jgi:NADH-quinone oxidoreductase subunit M